MGTGRPEQHQPGGRAARANDHLANQPVLDRLLQRLRRRGELGEGRRTGLGRNGAAATHYSIVVDVTKLPADNSTKQALATAGLTSLPIEMWVDSKGRLVQLTEALTVSGQSTSTKITISKYDQPVTITAPPADQVSTG